MLCFPYCHVSFEPFELKWSKVVVKYLVVVLFNSFMFMKLVKFNKFILEIKFINLQWKVVPNNILISPSHMTLGWTFYFSPFNHPFFYNGWIFCPFNFFLSNQWNIFPPSTLVFFKLMETKFI
jgi:hypothetical protein